MRIEQPGMEYERCGDDFNDNCASNSNSNLQMEGEKLAGEVTTSLIPTLYKSTIQNILASPIFQDPSTGRDLFSATLQEIDKEIEKFDLPNNVVGSKQDSGSAATPSSVGPPIPTVAL